MSSGEAQEEKGVVWSPEKTYALFALLHHLVVMFDDFLCDVGEFSRKPRGKYDPKSPGYRPS